MKDIQTKIALFPMPVLVVAAYDENNKINAMTAAWGTISAEDKIILFLDEKHKTTQNIRASKAFTVSIADKAHLAEADFFGIVTGNKMNDKFERSGCHATKSEHVNAPIIEDFPVVMECELAEIVETENLHAIIGKIVNAQADEKVLVKRGANKGQVNPFKIKALVFDQFQNNYYGVGRKIGKAWHEGAIINFEVNEIDDSLNEYLQSELDNGESEKIKITNE